jgi:chromosome segregation ATPase
MADKQTYIERINRELDQFRSQLNELKAKAQAAEADAKVAYSKKLEYAKARLRDTEGKINELQISRTDAWEPLRHEVEESLSQLRETFSSKETSF